MNLNGEFTGTKTNLLYLRDAVQLEYWTGDCSTDGDDCIYANGDCTAAGTPYAECTGLDTGTLTDCAGVQTCNTQSWRDWANNSGADSVEELFDGMYHTGATDDFDIDHDHRRWRVTVPASAWTYPYAVNW